MPGEEATGTGSAMGAGTGTGSGTGMGTGPGNGSGTGAGTSSGTGSGTSIGAVTRLSMGSGTNTGTCITGGGYVLRSNQTLTCSGTISAYIAGHHGSWQGGSGATGTIEVKEAHSSGQVTCPFGQIRFKSYQNSDKIGWELLATNAEGQYEGENAEYLMTTYGGSFAGSFKVYEGTKSGTYSISANVELCIEHIKPPDSNESGYRPDPPAGYSVRVFYRLRKGGSCTATITLDETTVTKTDTITQACEIPNPDIVNPSAQCDSNGYTHNLSNGSNTTLLVTGQSSVTFNYRGASLSSGVSVSGDHGTASASGTTVSVTSKNIELTTTADSSAGLSVAPAKGYSIDAVLRAMEVAYPDSVTMDWVKSAIATDTVTASGGSWSGSVTQRHESGFASTLDGDDDNEIHTFGPISLSLNQDWCSSASEDSSDRPILFKDRRISALTLSHASTFELHSGNDSTIEGGVRRSWTGVSGTPGWVSLMGYRFLNVAATMSGAGSSVPMTVRIGDFEYTQDKNGNALVPGLTSGNFTIDLCAPTNKQDRIDTADTTFPYAGDWITDTDPDGAESSAQRVGVGAYTGPNGATQIEVFGPNGATVTLGTLTLTRVNAPKITFLRPYLWQTDHANTIISSATTTEHFSRPFLTAVVDGRQNAIEETDTLWDRTTTDFVVFHTIYDWSISHLAKRINAFRNTGWSATVEAPALPSTCSTDEHPLAHHCYYNELLPSHGIFGGGALWNGSAWVYGFDSNPDTALVWQGGFTTVDFPGNVGDIFGHDDDAETGATLLKAAKILRGQVYGHVLQPSKVPAENITANLLEQPSNSNRGSGSSDAWGSYKTGTPFGRSEKDHKVKTNTLAADAYSIEMTPRRRSRAAFWLKNTSILDGGGGIVGEENTACKFKLIYFPFKPQFSDEHLLPVEEWRRIPRAEAPKRKVKKPKASALHKDESDQK